MKKTLLFSALFFLTSIVFSQESKVPRIKFDKNFISLDSTHLLVPIIWQSDGKFSGLKIEVPNNYTYRNLVFYNIINDSCKYLFTDSLQMFDIENTKKYGVNKTLSEFSFKIYKDSVRGVQIQNNKAYDNYSINYFFNNHVLYKVINHDYNNDQKLNSADPVYLYASNRDGTGLLQITPKNYFVKDYDYFENFNFILAILIEDSNNDKKFDSNDKELIYKINLTDFSKSKIIQNLKTSN